MWEELQRVRRGRTASVGLRRNTPLQRLQDFLSTQCSRAPVLNFLQFLHPCSLDIDVFTDFALVLSSSEVLLFFFQVTFPFFYCLTFILAVFEY